MRHINNTYAAPSGLEREAEVLAKLLMNLCILYESGKMRQSFDALCPQYLRVKVGEKTLTMKQTERCIQSYHSQNVKLSVWLRTFPTERTINLDLSMAEEGHTFFKLWTGIANQKQGD